MAFDLKITAGALDQVIQHLAANPARTLACPAGVSRLPDGLEFLVHNLSLGSEPQRITDAAVQFLGAETTQEMMPRAHTLIRRPAVRPLEALVVIGTGSAAGHLIGAVRRGASEHPLGSIRIVGPGLPMVRLLGQDTEHWPQSPSNGEQEMWSRTIGSLGENVWNRIRALRYCVIGCGRSGSVFANALWRLGARSLTLIDPDMLEASNVGEMDLVRAEDIGLPKAEALAIGFRALCYDNAPDLITVRESAATLPAIARAKKADILISCVDNPTARLLAAWIAKRHLIPLADIGSGVFDAHSNERRLGCDVRLVLPDRCLMCFGGIANLQTSRRRFPTPDPSRHVERAGSLRSLNSIAIAFACRLLEGLAGGRVTESRHLRVDFSISDEPQLQTVANRIQSDCRLCRLTGHGDGSLDSFGGVMASLQAPG